MTTAVESATVLKCRYRYATGCTADFTTKPGLSNHEKNMHAGHRVELRVCPECEADCGSDMARAAHLSNEHGIRAGSPRRQELDARQVQRLFAVRPAGEPAPGDGAGAAGQEATAPEAAAPVPPPGENQAASPELPVVRNILAALVDEVEALRARNASLQAENAALKTEAATWAKVRTMLAGHWQNGQAEHATALT
jgi:hypothetical protein